jgi:hypothetical protein
MRTLKIVLFTLFIATPVLAFAQEPRTFRDLASLIVAVLNRATVVMVAAALVLFLYGTAYNLFRAGEHGGKQLRDFMVWGVIALFVMVSIWGILNLLAITFLGGSAGNRAGAQPAIQGNVNVGRSL